MLKYSDKIKKIVKNIVEIKKRFYMTDNIIKPHLSLILKETSWLPKETRLNERFFCIINDMFEKPKCLECKIKVVNYKMGFLMGYLKFCSRKCASQNSDIKRKVKQTKKEKYGDENYNNAEKSRKTNLESYGVKHTFQVPEFRKKGLITKKEKYGDENFNNRTKANNTKLKKYGDIHFTNLEKARKTNLKKYGVEYTLQDPKIKKKITKTNLKKYGVANPFFINNKNYYSKMSQILFWKLYNQISKELQEKTYFAELNIEFFKNDNGKIYAYDFVISSKKICIEFNGDIWHGNPKIYNKSDCPIKFGNKKKITAGELWEQDIIKNNFLIECDFKMLIVWESEYKENPDKIIKNCLHFINNT